MCSRGETHSLLKSAWDSSIPALSRWLPQPFVFCRSRVPCTCVYFCAGTLPGRYACTLKIGGSGRYLERRKWNEWLDFRLTSGCHQPNQPKQNSEKIFEPTKNDSKKTNKQKKNKLKFSHLCISEFGISVTSQFCLFA